MENLKLGVSCDPSLESFVIFYQAEGWRERDFKQETTCAKIWKYATVWFMQ